ncbi:hypothetical protein ACO0QE_000255 [Hanseniaspora vineae]
MPTYNRYMTHSDAMSFTPNKDVVLMFFRFLWKVPFSEVDASLDFDCSKKSKVPLLFRSIDPLPPGTNANFEEIMVFMKRIMHSPNILLDFVEFYCSGFQKSQMECFDKDSNVFEFLKLLSVVSSHNSKYTRKEKQEIHERIDILERVLIEAHRYELPEASGFFAEGMAYILIPMLLYKGKRDEYLESFVPPKLFDSLKSLGLAAQNSKNKNDVTNFQIFKMNIEMFLLNLENIINKNMMAAINELMKNPKFCMSCYQNGAFEHNPSGLSSQKKMELVTRSILQLESSSFDHSPKDLLLFHSEAFFRCYNYLSDLQKGLTYLRENFNHAVKNSPSGALLIEQRDLVQELLNSCSFLEIGNACSSQMDESTQDDYFESAECLLSWTTEKPSQEISSSPNPSEFRTVSDNNDFFVSNLGGSKQTSFSKLNSAAKAKEKNQDAVNVLARLESGGSAETEYNLGRSHTDFSTKKDDVHVKFDLLDTPPDGFSEKENLDKAQQTNPSSSSDSEDVFFSYSSTANLFNPEGKDKEKDADLKTGLKVGTAKEKTEYKNEPISNTDTFYAPISDLLEPSTQSHTNLLPPSHLIAESSQKTLDVKPNEHKTRGKSSKINSTVKITQSVRLAKNAKVNLLDKSRLGNPRSKSAGATDLLSSFKKNRDRGFYNSEFSVSDETLDGDENELSSPTNDQLNAGDNSADGNEAKFDIRQNWLPITNHPLFAGPITSGHHWWIRSGKILSYEDQVKYIGDLHMVIDGLKYENFYLKGCMNLNE